MFKSCIVSIGLALAISSFVRGDEPHDKQVAELKQLQTFLPASKPFEQWLATGALPPDFDALPASPYPQDLLTVMRDAKPHRLTREEWPARRKEMRHILRDWLVGHAPPQHQDVRAVIEQKMHEPDKEIWQVRLEFGPEHKAHLHCWLWMSANVKKPAPVWLVDNFKYARFAKEAMDKGTFIVCIYNAADPAYIEYMPPYVKDRRDESDDYKDLFGKFDWSEFYRRGWSASRAVDWLSTLDFVDARHIYIGGHSRSAKQAMVGAAFDDRIAGVIASSPGSGGSLCYRDCDQYYYGECVESLTRSFPYWVAQRARFFTGRENKMPGDMHFEYALIAPRPVLMSTAIHDSVENTWSVEQMHDTIAPVWDFLGAPGNLAVRYRPGPHAPDDATYLAHSAWLEAMVEGKKGTDLFPYQPIHVWNYQHWASANPGDLDISNFSTKAPSDPIDDEAGKPVTADAWPARRDAIRKQIEWLLGDGPAYAPVTPDFTAGESDEAAKRLTRPGHDHARLTFGNKINANLYRPASAKPDAKLPAVIWLAPLQTSTGYVPHYREGDVPYPKWVKEGFAVLAYDPIGTADRQEERRGFYDRYPHWSLMGKMVLDARHAIDAAAADPQIDPKRIYLVGFAMGGMVATFTAALDDRVAGTATICGFTPFRTDTDVSPTGGMRRWSERYGWLPRLGPFIGHESQVPIDFDAILAASAPRPTLILAPTLDWHANHADVEKAVRRAGAVYQLLGAGKAITLSSPDHPCQFDNDMQATVIGWLHELAQSGS